MNNLILTNQCEFGGVIENSFSHAKFNHDKLTIENHIISGGKKNRNGQVVIQSGGDYTNFYKNPIVLYNHGNGILFDSIPPIAKGLNNKSNPFRIENDFTFADTIFNELQFSKDMYYLAVNGFLNAWSIGYLPTKKDYNEADNIMFIYKHELLEYSLVDLPANPDALNNALDIIKDDNFKRILVNNHRQDFIKSEVEKMINDYKLNNEFVSKKDYDLTVKNATDKYNDLVLKFNKLVKTVNKIQTENAIRTIKGI